MRSVIGGLLICARLALAAEEPAAPHVETPAAPTQPQIEHAAPKPVERTVTPDATANRERDAGVLPAPVVMKPSSSAPNSPPPSILPSALCDELRRVADGRPLPGSLIEQQRQLRAERERLERLNAEILKNRDALRVEIKRLEALQSESEKSKSAVVAPPVAAPVDAGVAADAAPVRSTAQLAALAKTVKSMKPDQAADLVSRIDRGLAVDLLERLSPSSAGAVMSRLKPELAAELMAALSTRPEKKREAP